MLALMLAVVAVVALWAIVDALFKIEKKLRGPGRGHVPARAGLPGGDVSGWRRWLHDFRESGGLIGFLLFAIVCALIGCVQVCS